MMFAHFLSVRFARRSVMGLGVALAMQAAAWAQQAQPQAAQAAAQRALSISAPWEITSLDPSKAGYIFTRLEVAETLVEVSNAGALVGGLASRWEVSKDQLTWRFKLRPAAKFHDGTAVTAQDAVRSLHRALANPGVLRNAGVKKISAEAGIVAIELGKPFTSLPAFLAHSSTQILAASSFAADGSIRAVIGSGPYKLSAVNAPQSLQAQRFAQYDGKAPAIEKINYLATSRGETRGMLAQSGQADLVFTHDAASFERFKQMPHLQFHSLPIPRTIYVKVNAGLPQLADVRVRQALSLAIDREGIASAILREPKAAATQLFTPSMDEWHVKGLTPLKRDVAQAKALLQAAGWQVGAGGMLSKAGKPFKVTLRTFPDRPELPPMAAALQAQFKEVGIELVVSVANSSEIPAGHKDGSLELALLARNYSLVPDPMGTLVQDFGPTGGDWGAMGWTSAQVRSALEALSSTADEKRRSALRGSLASVLHAELPVIPIAWYQHTATSSKRLNGVSIDPLERSYRVSQMRWAK
jgi:peptide/nickel transport system substrate-binding protein